MTRHLLDEVLDAPPKPRHIGLPQQTGADALHDPCGRGPLAAVPSVRLIPRPCSCTWRLRLGAGEATWTLTGTDPLCRMHGDSSDEKGGASA
jgi:hypothetical protein